MSEDKILKNKELLEGFDHDSNALYHINLSLKTKQKKDIFFSPWTPDEKETVRPTFNNKHNKIAYDKFLCSVKHSKYANPLKRFKSNIQNIESENLKEEYQKKFKPIRIYTLQNTINKQDKIQQKSQSAIFMDSTKQFKKKYKMIPNVNLEFNDGIITQKQQKSPTNIEIILEPKSNQKRSKFSQKIKRKYVNTIILDNEHMDRTFFNHTYHTKFSNSTECCKQTRKDFFNKQMINKHLKVKTQKIFSNDKDENANNSQLFLNDKKNKFRMNTEINIEPGIFIDYPRFKNSKIYSTFQPYKTKQERFMQQTHANMFRNKFQERKKKSIVIT